MKCKICGGEIEEIECYEMEVQEDRIIIEKMGACKNCRAAYLWEDYLLLFLLYTRFCLPLKLLYDSGRKYNEDYNHKRKRFLIPLFRKYKALPTYEALLLLHIFYPFVHSILFSQSFYPHYNSLDIDYICCSCSLSSTYLLYRL